MSTYKPSFPGKFLFRMAIPCLHADEAVMKKNLAKKFRFPDFSSLDENASPAQTPRAQVEVFGAWNAEGLMFQFSVCGKQRPVWCREHQPQISDRVELWIDTRDVRNVHRATRFCHRFLFMPAGGGSDGETPIAAAVPINRAKEHPNEASRKNVTVATEPLADGYFMTIRLDAKALTGYYPEEHSRLGVAWGVCDREMGDYTLTAGTPFAYQEDPSLWYTLELIR